MGDTGSGTNGELTREILRSEIRAGLATQENKFRDMLDTRFAPVNEHIGRVERGELTPAQKASIINVVQESADQRVIRKTLKVPMITAMLSIASLIGTVMLTLVGFHVV